MSGSNRAVKDIVGKLFANGKRPYEHYGIDGNKIDDAERRNPSVSKQIPLSKRVS